MVFGFLSRLAYKSNFYVNLYSEEENARKYRVFSSFLVQNGLCFSFVTEKFLIAGGKFLSAGGEFLSAVGACGGPFP